MAIAKVARVRLLSKSCRRNVSVVICGGNAVGIVWPARVEGVLGDRE